MDRLRRRIVELRKEKSDTRKEMHKLAMDEKRTAKDIDKIKAIKEAA